MTLKLLIASDRALLETRPEYRYSIINQALRNFTLKFTDQNAIDEFWWTSEPERVLKEKLHVTDPEIFWKSYNRQDTPDFRKQLSKPYSDVNELEQARKKIKVVLLAHDHPELAKASLEKLPKLDSVISVPRDASDYEKKIENEIKGALKKHAVKTADALLVSNMKEDLEAAEKNQIKAVYIERKGTPSLKWRDKITSLEQIKSFL